MEKITLKYHKPYCKIYHYQHINCICLEWIGFANFENFKEACNFSLDLLKQYKASKMIANNTHAKVVLPKSQTWLQEVWFPKAYEQGYRTSAVVVSKNIFNELGVKNIVNQMEQGKFEVRFFNDLSEAESWLQ